MSKGSSGTNTVTQQSGPPSQVLQNYEQVYNQAQNVAAQPNQPYTGATVAGFTPLQQSGFNNLPTAVNAGQPFINQASQDITNASTALDPTNFASTVGAYESPYTKQVVDATQNEFNNQNAQQQQQVEGNAVSSGAWGGDRSAVAQGITAGQEALAQAPVIANLENTGFQNATNTAQSDAWLNSQAGFGMASLGQEAQTQGLTGVQAELGAGATQQAEAQQELNVPYQAYQAATAYPFQTTNWLEGMATGTGSLSGTEGSTTSPGPSTASQVAGLAATGVGVVGATGGFGANGWLTNAFKPSYGAGSYIPLSEMSSRGGAIGTKPHDLANADVIHRAAGGSMPGSGVTINSEPLFGFSETGYHGYNGLSGTTPHQIGGMSPIPAAANLSVTGVPATTSAGGSSGLLGGGGNLLDSNTGTTSTTSGGGDGESTLGSILQGAGQIAAGIYGGPAGAAAAGALNSEVHFEKGGRIAGFRGLDAGGDVTPGLAASVGGNPMLAQAAQSYNGLPTEQLQELASRFPPTSPQGSLVQRALHMRQMSPGSNPGQPTVAATPGMTPMQQPQQGMFARGGEADDDDALPDLVMPQVGPSVPGGLSAGLTAGMGVAPTSAAMPPTGRPPSSLLDAVATAVHQNESGGRMTPGIVGDNGKSAGPMQVQQGVIDQVNHKLGTHYSFDDLVQNPAVGKMVGEAHLEDLLSKYGEPAYAMGAYNAGEGAMDRALRTGQGVSGLPHSTQDYISRGLRSLQSMQGAARGGAIRRADAGAVYPSDWADLSAFVARNEGSPVQAAGLGPIPQASSDASMSRSPQIPIDPEGGPTSIKTAGLSPAPPQAPDQAGSDDSMPTPPIPPTQQAGLGPVQPQDVGSGNDGAMKASPWESLMAAGLGMMAGTSSHALTNIGAGGLTGLKDYQQQKQLAIQDQMRQDAAKTNQVWRMGQLGNAQDRTALASAIAGTRAPLIAAQTDAANARAGALEAGKPKFQYLPQTMPDPDDPSKTISGFSKIDVSGKQDPTFIRTDTNPNKGAGAAAAGVGGREGVYINRVTQAANAATAALSNIAELPTTASTGVLGYGGHEGPGVLSALKNTLVNHVTSQGVQDYNTMLTGVSRNLATLEAAGLAPGGGFTNSFNSLAMKEGQSELTKMRNMAEMRQIIEKNLEPNLANPRLPPEQKQMIQGIINQVQKVVPFTQHDITQFQASPAQTMSEFARSNKLGQARQPSSGTSAQTPAAPAAPSFVDGQIYQDGGGNKAMYKNGQWVPQ